MIRVASGEPLSIKQDDIRLNGWAVESRVYAEDPKRNFLPATGRVVRYAPPEDALEFCLPDATNTKPVIRCDSGIEAGGEISMFYDPMIAKLCTWATTREAAIKHMGVALDEFELQGSGDNLHFLSAIAQHPRFNSGDITTAFIAEEYPDGFAGVEADARTLEGFVGLTTLLSHITANRRTIINAERPHSSAVIANVRTQGDVPHVVRIGSVSYPVSLVEDGIFGTHHSEITIRIDQGQESTSRKKSAPGSEVHIETDWLPGQRLCHAKINGKPRVFQVKQVAEGFQLQHQGCVIDARLLSQRKAALADLMIEKEPEDTANLLLCPMPGLLVAVHVSEGESVEEGQALAIVEAMKMENVLLAERSGTIAKISTEVGQSLSVDDVILEFEV